MLNKMKFFLIEWLGALIIWLLGHTIRWRVEGYEDVRDELTRGCVLPFWHNRILMVAYFMRNRRTAALISKHRDGEIIARVASHFGHLPIRGSTGKCGKEAVPMMVNKIKEGIIMGITPDGPLGPRYKLHPGTILLGYESKRPIIPIIISARNRFVLNTWDGFIIPKPFTIATVVFGGPFYTNEISSPGEFEKERQRIETEMMKLVERAEMSAL